MALPDADARKAAEENLDAAIALSAGAGSGKTRALVSRYLNILQCKRATVPEIVAVTFTEKAAAEMRSRIRAECRQRAREAAEEEERRRWQRHERDLEAAPVSTIHSLCARILREHAIGATIDPQFSVLEEAPAALLMSEAVYRYVLRRVHDGAESMRQIVAAFGVEKLSGMMSELIGSREKWIEWVEAIPDIELAVSRRLADDAGVRSAVLQELVDGSAWREAIATLESTVPLDPDDLAAQRRAAILEHNAVAADGSRNAEDRLEALSTLRSHCKSAGKQASWASPDDLAAVKDAFVALRQLYEETAKQVLTDADGDVAESSARLSLALAVELRGAYQEYQSAKRQRSLLDVADLQLAARALLRDHPRIRSRYQDQLKFVMIDEFQDTNELQKEILFALAGSPCGAGSLPAAERAADGPPGEGRGPTTAGKAACPTPGKVFIVGDDKQSIYRFRGADVRVFNVTRREFTEIGGAENHELTVNFRSQRSLVAFYNYLFAHDAVMGTAEREAPYVASYSPLEPHRSAPLDAPDVEIILARSEEDSDEGEDDNEDASVGELRETEAAAIAQRIEEMCAEGGLKVFDPDRDDSDGPRAAQYGDIAILFRALTDVRTYERALRRRGIPYYLLAGQGLYRRQEIRDLLCLLRALENTRDEVALVGALRSPLFSLSDETLYWLCHGRHPYEALQHLAHEPQHGQFAHIALDEREKAIRAATILCELRHVKDRLSVSQLLTTVVQQTGLMGALLAQFNGEQTASNVRKLIDLAAGFERSPTFSLHEFIGYLQHLIVTEQREGEAPIQGEEENVVKLLTIHKAKGLQWPIVVVPDLGRRPPVQDAQSLWHEEYGLIVKGEDDTGKRGWPVAGRAALRLDGKMEDAERRRLLYVACTRARDHLILSSPWKAGKSGQPDSRTWMAWIAAALGIDDDTPDGPLAAADGNAWSGILQSFAADVLQLSRRGRRTKPMADRHGAELRSGQPLPGAVGERELATRVQPLPAVGATQQRFTVTQLAAYCACPREYELRYVRDLPEYYPPSPGKRGPLLSPLDRGTVVHRCLQRIGQEREEDVDKVVRSCLREFGLAPAADEPTQRDIAGMVNAFLDTPLFELVREASRLRPEAPFALRLDGGVIVEGQVDATAWDSDGAIHLIDYKTGRGDDRAMEQYRFQLALYCVAVEAAFGAPPASATLYELEQAESHALDLPEDANQAMRNALASLEGIRAGRFPRGDGRHCPRCRHDWICGGAHPRS